MLGLTVQSHFTPGLSSVGLHRTIPIIVPLVLSGCSICRLSSPSGLTTGAGGKE